MADETFAGQTNAWLRACGPVQPDMILLDALPAPSANAPAKLGGTGQPLNWDMIAAKRGAGELDGWPPLVLAGGLRPDNVAGIRVGLSKAVYDMHGTLPWSDRFKALLSAPYIMSIILHDRRCWLEQFEPKRFQDPGVDKFIRERVQVVMDPTLQGTAAVVEVHTNSAQTFTDRRTCAKGDPDDPLSRAEIQDKLRTAALGLLTREKVERIVTLLDRLEDIADVRELTAALRRS